MYEPEVLLASLNSEPLCGADGRRCRDAATEVWQNLQTAAARFDDDAPSCKFTTFIAYEHTATPKLTKIHRNVIFRNDRVPIRPISYSDEPTGLGLWQALEEQCLEGIEGCDVLAIPHNSNLSNGRLFTIEYPEGSSRLEQARFAALRGRMEPVVEMMQIKGESECRSGMWKVLGADEDCEFEKFRALHEVEDCEDGVSWGALGGKGCRSRLDFARYALIEGLREADRIGETVRRRNEGLWISALTGEGLETLKSAITDQLTKSRQAAAAGDQEPGRRITG